jgi:4-aminobutyrate aminotransferase
MGDVRGRGLMIGVEFTGADGHADKTTCKAVAAACLKRRLMLLTCGSYENVIRWIPPLVVSAAQIDEALGIYTDALREVVGQPAAQLA